MSGPAAGAAHAAVPAPAVRGPRRGYRWFILPGLVATLAIIVFPWVFTVWMSFHEWQLGGRASWVGWRNYAELATNQRFREAIWHTFYFSFLAVVLPLALGTAAAVVFHREFPLRGLLRTLFIMPMMATPVAIALIWTMMFHPQLGVLNYLLGLVGIGPSEWVFARATVIPSLALVEIWLWTPFVMIIVLGGLIEERVEDGEQKIPLLGDLPVLGGLFRYEGRKRSKTNLLVFLRPIVLRDAESSNSVTATRYDYIRALRGEARVPASGPLPELVSPPLPVMPAPPSPGTALPPAINRPPASLAPDVDAASRSRRGAAPPPASTGGN